MMVGNQGPVRKMPGEGFKFFSPFESTAKHGVVAPAVLTANFAGYQFTGRQTHTNTINEQAGALPLPVDFLQFLQHGIAGQHGAQPWVLQKPVIINKYRLDGIADELVNLAAKLINHGSHTGDMLIQEGGHQFGLMLFAHGGKASNI